MKFPAAKKDINKLSHLAFLYRVAHCKMCRVGVHVACLGRRELEVLKLPDGPHGAKKPDLLLFTCDSCVQDKPLECLECKKPGGLVRKMGEQGIHQICAMALGYPLIDAVTMEFGPLSEKRTEGICGICENQGGVISC